LEIKKIKVHFCALWADYFFALLQKSAVLRHPTKKKGRKNHDTKVLVGVAKKKGKNAVLKTPTLEGLFFEKPFVRSMEPHFR